MSEMQKNVIVHGDSRLTIPKIHTPINCVITDPPYGMNFKSNMARTPHGKKLSKKIANDDDIENAIEMFLDIMWTIVPKLAPDADIYVFSAWHVSEWWIPAVKQIDPSIELKMQLIWNKGDPGLGDLEGNWGCGYEVILYLKKGRRPIPFRRGAVISVDKIPPGQMIHPSEKPVALLEHLIRASTSPGDLIVDPFSGSGSTCLAAQKMGRNSLAFEIDEDYIAPSRSRLAQVGFGLPVD